VPRGLTAAAQTGILMKKTVSISKPLLIVLIIIAAAAVICVLYGFLIEPKMLIKKRFSVDFENGAAVELTEGENPAHRLKIVTLSDIHFGFGTPLSYVEKLVEKANAETPDLIFFTGDLKTRSTYLDKRIPEAVEVLSKLNAKYGKFAVYGNHDTFFGFADIMEKSGFTLLTNDGVNLEINGETVFIGGINSLSLTPNAEKTLKDYADPYITIILAHEPDLAYHFIGETENALILSGHLHGGQINLPVITKWWLTSGGEGNTMINGFYKNGGNQVFVSAGIGMSVLPARFNAPPQFEVIYIK
jgi:predicted MPP superfamily phosphohydrolase